MFQSTQERREKYVPNVNVSQSKVWHQKIDWTTNTSPAVDTVHPGIVKVNRPAVWGYQESIIGQEATGKCSVAAIISLSSAGASPGSTVSLTVQQTRRLLLFAIARWGNFEKGPLKRREWTSWVSWKKTVDKCWQAETRVVCIESEAVCNASLF